jgi:hypothetical protein
MVQNSDISIRLTITDGTTAYVINDLDDYEIYLYTLVGKEKNLIANYKKSNAGKYGISVFDSASGKIDIVIHRQDTKDIDGKLYAEVRIRVKVTSDFVSGVQNLGETGIEIDTVLKSAAPTLLP